MNGWEIAVLTFAGIAIWLLGYLTGYFAGQTTEIKRQISTETELHKQILGEIAKRSAGAEGRN